MAQRSTTSEYQPAPPTVRLGGRKNGAYTAGHGIRTQSGHPGIKPNVGAPPVTNGERAFGKVAPSNPEFATSMKSVTPRISR